MSDKLNLDYGLDPSLIRDIINYADDNEAATTLIMQAKEKFVLEHHHRAITYLENKGAWKTYLGKPRKEVKRKNKADLIDYLYTYYKCEEHMGSTIREVYDRCEDYRLHVLNRAEGTVIRDKQVLRRFFTDNFLSRPITTLTDKVIGDYVNRRTKELQMSERALKDSLQLLNRIFEYAMKQEKIITDNPVSRIDLQNYYQNCDNTKKKSDEKIFTAEEIEAIKNLIWDRIRQRPYDIIGYAMLFSIATGVRVAEIPPLRWEDVTDKGIHIHRQQRVTRRKGQGRIFDELPFTKNERRHPNGGRYFPITVEIQKILDEIKEKQKNLCIRSDFIFCNADGTWMDKDIYSQRLRRLCRRCGLNITNNHAFRMSLNSNVFIPLGIPVTQRAYLLGHSVETNERHYSYMRTESLTDIKDLLNGSRHSQAPTPVIDFPASKNPATPVKSRVHGI